VHKLNSVTKACGVFLLWATTAIVLPAQTFTTLHNFDGSDGSGPFAALVQGADGNLYGTTSGGGANGGGTVFKITPSGALNTLYSFCSQSSCTDGAGPTAGLVQATDGNFYGTTSEGGANDCVPYYGCGTVFRVTPSGTLTTLHSFDGTDGELLEAGLLQGTDGSFYGTTSKGGANTNEAECANGCGTVFKITTDGKLTMLYSFCSRDLGGVCTDGAAPEADLVQGADGNFYGTTYNGGKSFTGCQFGSCGIVFKMTPNGALKRIHAFCSEDAEGVCADGANSSAGLVQGTDGNFYGTTQYGGRPESDSGTIFKITPSGFLTTAYEFCSQSGCTDGEEPTAGLVQGTDGNLYGTTSAGGENNNGAIFGITPGAKLKTLHSFDGGDGDEPDAALLQDTNGNFYGTATYGGANGYGTVFGLSMGLGPFVRTNPAFGKVDAAIGILGTNLTGATSVSFNGTAAEFKVASATLIAAKVPSGATTGTVQVQLPSGTLSSNVPFIVLH